MIGFLRLAIFGTVAAALSYWALLIYSRSLRREALEKEWDGDWHEDASPEARALFIEEGMAEYEHSLRRKLIWLVLVLPAVVVGVLIYLVNYA
ncbi:hypothetical protein [Paenirhodobacter sp. CAU 1674]|jgi:hypothetical protein|uniref:hypothetical protein n=1 Tax=Paenirhodobacter sp. CAU 1674 TaxID=3032596 RepID=UPI0023DB4705|nr:hypothetical protein [Paenirhodobacter sp. CAU 1674]MDF2143150.1 hypothetical protein [Paenirhodobacter sp. CAU 1674]